MSDSSFAFQCASFNSPAPVVSRRTSRPRRAEPQVEIENAMTAYAAACKSWLPRLRSAGGQSEGVVRAVAEVALSTVVGSSGLGAANGAVFGALSEALRQPTDKGFIAALARGLVSARPHIAAALAESPRALEHVDHEGYLERIGSVLLAFAYQVEAVGRWRRYGAVPHFGHANTLEVDDLVEVADGGARLVRVCFITSDEGPTRALFAGFVDSRWEATARARGLELHPGGLVVMAAGAIEAYPSSR